MEGNGGKKKSFLRLNEKSMPRLFRGNSAPEVEDEEEQNRIVSSSMVPQEEASDEGTIDVDRVGFCRHIFLSWITSLINVGFKQHKLDKKDLWKLRSQDDPEMLSEKMVLTLNEYWVESEQRFKPYALIRTCGRVFFRELFLSGCMELLFSLFRFGGPIILREMILYIQQDVEVREQDPYKGYIFAVLLFLSQFASTVCQSHSRYLALSIGLKIKNGLSLATFKHIMKVDETGRQKMSNGQVLNLISTDANVAPEFMRLWNRMWSAPIVLTAGIIYIYFQIGVSVFFGLLVMLLFVPVSIYFGKIQTRLQREKMIETDKRVKLVSEMMQGVKVMKLNGWEAPLLKILNWFRKIEMKAIRRLHYYRGLTMPLAISIPNVASVVTFGAYILFGNELGPASAFAVVSAFVIIRQPFVTLPLAINLLTRAIVSEKRFLNFFCLSTSKERKTKHSKVSADDELGTYRIPATTNINTTNSFREIELTIDGQSNDKQQQEPDMIVVKDGSFQWSQLLQEPEKKKKNKKSSKKAIVDLESGDAPTNESEPFKLKNINLNIKRGELVGIIGRIGEGKSSLVSALLGDMKKTDGLVQINGSIAFCQQEPFIMNRTVRDNILFDSLFDEDRYNMVLEASSLLPDLKILPAGDLTEIGERGVNLSGGQKSRISLARAIYANKDIFILDDILSAVDAHVGKFIFQNCLSNQDNSLLNGKTRIMVTNQLHLLEYMDRIILLQDGEIIEQGTYEQVITNGDISTSKIKALHEEYTLKAVEEDDENAVNGADGDEQVDKMVGQILSTSKNLNKIDESIVKSEKDEKKEDPKYVQMGKDEEKKELDKGKLTFEEEREKGNLKTYYVKQYWLAGTKGSMVGAVLIFSTFVLAEISFLSIDTWLAYWSQLPRGEISDSRFLGVYYALLFGFLFIMAIRAVAFAMFSIQACKALYYNLQNNVFYLPMSFFWSTPIGRVTNRLTRDTNDIDTMLPLAWKWLMMTLMRVMGVLVIISYTVPIFLAGVVPFFLMYLLIREYYRRSSVSAQRIESILRSPVFSHLSETLNGVTTLKAFGKAKKWTEEGAHLIATNHRAKFTMEVIKVWLSMRLEFVGALIVLLTAVCIVATNADPGFAGLAIAYSLNLVVNLNFSVIQATQVEALMNAVERVVEYSNLESEKNENKLKDIPAEKGWPLKGKIEFENVVMSYRSNLDPALRNVNFTINPGEKVGIVGQTGSGKTTLLTVLFNLHPILSGKILIDGLDISKLSKHALRRSITCIPQDPVLFSTTLRENIDPFNENSDEKVWKAIDKAHLRKTVESLPDGLNSRIAQGGENLSVGERQLVCIARAALRDSKILFLDEATANIDRHTDKLIQKSIREGFTDCTMLVIAHRLNTVLDLDKILVMDKGRVAEFETVQNLLDNPESKLKGLVKAASSK